MSRKGCAHPRLSLCTAACPHLSGYDGDHISDVSVDGGREDWFSRGYARPRLRLYPPCLPCDIVSDDGVEW